MNTESKTVRPGRRFIFAPGLKPDRYPKALSSGADIVCVELEEGIAPKDKELARQHKIVPLNQAIRKTKLNI